MSQPSETTAAPLLAPLKYPIFRNIWITGQLSNFGGMVQMTGASWLMTQLSGSSDMVALVQVSVTLPIVFFSLPAGAMADNFNRRNIMLTAQAFLLCVSVLLMVCVWLGWMTPWVLLCFTFLIGSGGALNIPSWQASVSEIVPRHVLSSAVMLNNFGFNLTRSVAPAIGGMIVAAAGSLAAFGINTLSYFGLLTVLGRWKPNYPQRTLPRERIGRAIGAGLRYVMMSPNMMRIYRRGMLFGFGAVAVTALMPVVVRLLLEKEASTYGFMLGAFGAGGAVVAFINQWVRTHVATEWIARLAFWINGAAIGLIAVSHWTWLTGVGVFLSGASWVLLTTLLGISVQFSAPRWVLGRALSIHQTALFAGLAFGAATWGWMAEYLGITTALYTAAGFLIAGGFFGFFDALPEQSKLNLASLNLWTAPPLGLDLKPYSGPILIEVEYIIEDDKVEPFLTAMNQMRRIRLRNGSHRWMLTRNIEEPERWTMSYQFPTWIEYVRHNQRITEDDSEVHHEVLKLHTGSEPPRVRRTIERHTDLSSAISEEG